METAAARTAIEQTVNKYFRGMHFRSLEELRSVFHPTAHLYGHLSGVFSHRSLEEWLEGVASRPVPAESGEPFDMKIISIEITGQIAVVKVEDLYRGFYFTDYLSLVETEGQWQIVNKIFHYDP
jgi:hypothetical protein